jgi:hypothetical protein
MAGESETRASRDADDGQILGERERDASDHGAPNPAMSAHESIRISSIRADKTRLDGCASLAQGSDRTPPERHSFGSLALPDV